jgi:predicted lipid-binding transport protein (Tim44 family)
VTVDFDPKQPPPGLPPTLVLLSGDGSVAPVEVPLRWEDADRMGAHVTLTRSGTVHPVVKLAGRALRLPPSTLPYPPEFQPGSAREGQALLAELARMTGGLERLSMAGLFAQSQESLTGVPLAPALAILGVVGLLAEVMTRRFLAGRRRRPGKAVGVESGTVARREEPARGESPKAPRAGPARPRPSEPDAPGTPPEAPAPEAPTKRPGMNDALEQARARARERLKR